MLPLFEGQNEIRRRALSRPTLVSLCASLLLALAALITPGALCALDRPDGWLHPDPDHLGAGRFAQVVTALDLVDDVELAEIRQPLLDSWAWQHSLLRARVEGNWKLAAGAADQIYDRHLLCQPEDVDPLGVVLRRTGALLDYFAERFPAVDMSQLRAAHRLLVTRASAAQGQAQRRLELYYVACAVRRRVALRNPLLDFDQLLFVARGNDTRTAWSHGGLGDGRHFVSQYQAFASLPGGGIYAVSDFKSRPVVRDLIAGRSIVGGSFAGKTIDQGVYLSPELSFDGQRLLFCWAPITHWSARWDEDTVWQIYECELDGQWATQLTSGPYNDFDPCYLPDGRIAFVSERRGGYVRCFNADTPSRNYVLHAMNGDGSDILPLSWFETCEWQPSLTHDGRLVYTRWDYVDRDLGQGQNLWFCYPDGRDPRAPHGNYPQPHYVPPDARPDEIRDGRRGRPFCEFHLRAVPESNRYIACAVPQHGLAFGALVLIDPTSGPDDAHMSQVRRLTPYQAFPESEGPAFSDADPSMWGTPWPLSDDFYLCNRLSDICLLDRFGNVVVLCEKELIPDWQRWLWVNPRQGDNGFRLLDPIPVRSRPRPPVIPCQTTQGQEPTAEAPAATISITNVYRTDMPLPEGSEIKWLRIVQQLAKTNSQQDDPGLGYGVNNSGRMVLGIVPVEADGSVFCEAPVGKQLVFQLLDGDYRAVHSMRSVTYVHPGERLACVGCHEPPTAPQNHAPISLALQRAPSELAPDVGGVEPITFYRMVQPVFERSCIPCHQQQQRGPRDMQPGLLTPYVWYYYGGDIPDVVQPERGGTRTMPGKFGAHNCRMGRALMDADHRGQVSQEDLRRVFLWLDNNSPLLGACHSPDQQQAGGLVWPKLDVDPANPQGLERLWDAAGLRSLNRPAYLSVADFHRLRGTLPSMNERPDWTVAADRWDGGPGAPRGWKRRTWGQWESPK
jgi:hypothetical protein